MVAVFLPPTPVPTAGFLVFVPREKITILDMSPEDGAKLLISGGLVSPEYREKLIGKELPPPLPVPAKTLSQNHAFSDVLVYRPRVWGELSCPYHVAVLDRLPEGQSGASHHRRSADQ